MFQTFDATTSPEQGPPRIAALRAAMVAHGVDAFVAPRADAHQGEYVAARDDRLAWLTGFTGSAGFAVVLADQAGIFVDGRYSLQVRDQVDTSVLTPVDWPKTKLGPWLKERVPDGKVGIDPWLHTTEQVEALEAAGLSLVYVANLVDEVWEDQPDPPVGKVEVYPVELSGKSHADKRSEVGKSLGTANAAVLTLPDSISWLLNVRGSDLPHTPSVQAFAILAQDGGVRVFTAPEKLAPLAGHLGAGVSVHPGEEFAGALADLDGPVRVDRASAPFAVVQVLRKAGVEVAWGADPCSLPKATKTAAEIAATTEAHLRDGAAMVEFLAWLDEAAPKGGLTEIDVVETLEGCRRATNVLRDISFDTISGAGPNGAVVHYRVTRETNREITPGDLLLVDSGGQYVDGTTDVTRTVTTGTPSADQVAAFTNVLKGVIAISRARWPNGLSGRDLDPLARAALWRAGQDYDHGTGHGVGVFLSVHEGPQRLSRASDVPLKPGMILSNEPGYYREGEWGIRIENLVVVEVAPKLDGGDEGREQLCFGTLTYVPVDTRLVDAARLSPGEREWLNAYHAEVEARIGPRVSQATGVWLRKACRPI
ncbi:MAG: aminopeptidase P family protein [Pseudomonadota bacterium]